MPIKNPHALLGVLFASTSLTAQAPSVLQLQKSYHLAIYSTTIDVPTGAVTLLSERGGFDMLPNGTFSGALSRFESTIAGTTFVLNESLDGTYSVDPDGITKFDFDPGIPGTGEADLWITADGVCIHASRAKLSTESLSILAIEKSTGQSNASLVGDYYYSGQYMELFGGELYTSSTWGIATFDGLGVVTLVGTQMLVDATGATTTSPVSTMSSYTVDPDGELDLGFTGLRGAVSADGELLFGTSGTGSLTEVGMIVAVRLGTNYDFNDLEGRYGMHAQAHILGVAPNLPQTTTDFTELDLTATSAATGSWDSFGITVDGNQQSVFFGTSSGSGNATITSNGIMSLGSELEIAVSSNGKYLVGRVIEPQTNLWFGTRQVPVSESYGAGTSGTNGIIPAIGMSTFPTLGNSNWALTVADALGGSFAVMAINFSSLPGASALGGQIWVNPIGAYTPLIVLGGSAGVPGAGSGQTTVPLPNLSILAGVDLFAQAVVLDAGAAADFSMSPGFRAELGQ